MNLAGCYALSTTPENNVWYRAIQPQHWPTALQTSHTTRIPSRYSPATSTNPAFPVLYLAEDHQVALFETEALLGSPLPGRKYIPNPRQAWIILNVQVTLQAVADLTIVSEQFKLLTTAQELTGDWDCYRLRTLQSSVSQPMGLAPTQVLG
jgi:RES domain-containing protein